ncbi:MAG TPA: maleylpyruvate isomerase family mycothiol-dependent enzyme [Acidimicrobiales bacterium]|nr:maleylpyruvate isomerase family mycothiol-dependent enzyme [Acidimicrobiales bacterium]
MHLDHCDALTDEVNRFALVLSATPSDTPVPSCPGWTTADLAEHLGTVHRWAEHLVRARATERIASDVMEFSRGPVTAQWIREGGAQLCSTLRSSDPNVAMWAWGEDQHLKFWSRRQLHETLVHRMDLELAVGLAPHASAEIASDAIDEFLVNLARAAYFSPRVTQLRGDGQLIRMSTIDSQRTWTVELGPDGFSMIERDETATVQFEGPAAELLLALYRRVPISKTSVDVVGDERWAAFWLDHSALE